MPRRLTLFLSVIWSLNDLNKITLARKEAIFVEKGESKKSRERNREKRKSTRKVAIIATTSITIKCVYD